jgi:ATP-dependent Clp protease, protease subunit
MPNMLMRLLRDNAQARVRRPAKAESAGEEATLYLYDVIVSDDWWGGVCAEEFVKELMSISAPVIHIRVNSPGGEVFAARAIEAAIREHKSRCIAHIDGYAASAASFVAIACDEVEISKNAFFMIHKAWTMEAGNSDDFVKTAAWLDKIDATLAETYAAKTGLSFEDVAAMMAEETWLTAQEAVDRGFADRIAEPEEKAQATWNLSAYSKAPALEQPTNATEVPNAKALERDDDQASKSDNRERYERLSRLHGKA